jgi:hypothetical protein
LNKWVRLTKIKEISGGKKKNLKQHNKKLSSPRHFELRNLSFHTKISIINTKTLIFIWHIEISEYLGNTTKPKMTTILN